METCVDCGLAESEPRHGGAVDGKWPAKWHRFRGASYVDALEDALLFVREKKALHEWKDTGLTVDTSPSFSAKFCLVCGGTNWGGKNDGVCFGDRRVEGCLNSARNRRAFKDYTGQDWVNGD